MNNILNTDALTGLQQFDSDSIDCCITSPPYYGLRDYKTDGQIGLEKTFEEYLDKLIQIFNQVKRVLKKEGSCWVVMGDTYSGSGNGAGDKNLTGKCKSTKGVTKFKLESQDLPDKSMMMVPERFAIKMIDSGWILRNKIIWYKPNCMPSSAKDRFTVDYEFIYFFVRSKKYYFKTQYEPHSRDWDDSDIKGWKNGTTKYTAVQNSGNFPNPRNPLGRLKRTVWKISPKPFPDAHFAVFPTELVDQCLDAGCPPNGITLDPFMGSGTVALQALKTNRQFIGIELNKSYVDMAYKRIEPYLLQEKLI